MAKPIIRSIPKNSLVHPVTRCSAYTSAQYLFNFNKNYYHVDPEPRITIIPWTAVIHEVRWVGGGLFISDALYVELLRDQDYDGFLVRRWCLERVKKKPSPV